MRRIFFVLFLVALMAAWCTPGFAAQDYSTMQQVTSTGTTLLGPDASVPPHNGVTKGAEMKGAVTITGVLEVTADDGIFTNNTTDYTLLAVYSDTQSQGNILFDGSSNVHGGIAAGDGTQVIRNITANGVSGTAVNFLGKVRATRMDVGAGTVDFKSGTNDNAVTIVNFVDGASTTGKITLESSTTVTGALTTDTNGQGTLELKNASQWTGQVGASAARLKTVNFAATTSGATAGITGAVFTNAFSLLSNTLNINGALTTGPSSAIATTLTGTSAGLYGHVVPTGFTTIGTGSVVTVTVPSGTAIPLGTLFNIIDASSGNTGTFTINDSAASGYHFTAVTIANGKVILLTNTSSAPTGGVVLPAVPATQSSLIAGAASSPDMLNVLTALNALPAASQSVATSSMTPTTDGAVTQASTAMLNNFIDNTETHLCNVRTTSGNTGIATGDDYIHGIDIWAQGLGDYAHQDPRGSSNGYNATSWGVSGGADKVFFNDSFRMGLGSGYGQTFVRSKDFSGHTDIDSIPAVIYGNYQNCMYPFYIDAAFTFVYNMYNGSRQITDGPTITRTANADYDGEQYSGYIEGGYAFFYKKISLTPLASFNYMHLHVGSYTETGADALNLGVKAQDYDMAQTGLGAKLMYPFDLKCGTLTPDFHFKWLYDWIGDNQATTAGFAGGGTSFGTNGFSPAQSAYDFGTRLNLKTKYNVTLGLDYDFLFKEDYYEHYGTVTVKYSF